MSVDLSRGTIEVNNHREGLFIDKFKVCVPSVPKSLVADANRAYLRI